MTDLSRARGQHAVTPRQLSRWLWVGLLVCSCLLLGAADEGWLTEHSAVLSFNSPAESYELVPACPSRDVSLYLSLTYRQPGTILDTVGINAAPEGAWNLTIDSAGRLAFSIYSPNNRLATDLGNGWHRYALPQPLIAGRDYNLAMDIASGYVMLLLYEGDTAAGTLYEPLPCGIERGAVFAGDYPGDDHWGAGYNIHPAFVGDLQVWYFGPQIDELTPDNVTRTWVNSYLQWAANQPDLGDVQMPAEVEAHAGNTSQGDPGGELFTLGYNLEATGKEHYPQGDCLEALLTASPLYGGAAGGPGVQTQELDRLRQAKVAEIVELAGLLTGAVAQLQPELRALEAAYATFLRTGLTRDPSLEPYVVYTLQELAGMRAQAESALERSGKLTQVSGDPLADANIQYVGVAHTVMLAGLCLKQADSLCLFAALPQGEFAASGDQQLVQAAADLEQALAQYDALTPQLAQVARLMAEIDCGLQQLEAADYYVGWAGLEFMGEYLPELERQLQGAKVRPGLSAEQLAQAQEVLRYHKLMQGVLAENLAGAPVPPLIAQAPATGRLVPSGVAELLLAAMDLLGPQPAWAAERQLPTLKNLAISMKSIREVADLPRDPENPTFGESLKQAYRRFSSDVNQALDFKKARKQWGKGVDSAGAYVHQKTREGMGWWYGNTPEEIEKDVEENYARIAQNQADGREGTETYRTAKKYMEDTEKLADEAAKDFIEKSFGGKLAPWMAGKIAKGLTSVFTGLAKGIYAVADPSSTPGEMAVGVAEIALAGTAGNAVGYQSSLAGFKQMLSQALGMGSMKECLNVVLNQYKEDLGKELLGGGLDGQTVLESFLSFLGVDPAQLAEFAYDGNYLGQLTGGASGTIAFTIQGTTWAGSVSGSFAWTMEGTEISGVSEFSGSLYGSFNPATGALSGEVSGTANRTRFAGPISGSVVRDVGGACVARGSWQGSDKVDTLSGNWSANRQ